MTMKKKRIVVTGGHLTPALAVIDELLKRGGWQIFFFGRKYAMEGDKTPSVEFQVMVEKDLPFVALKAGRLQRRFTRHTLPAALRIPFGFFQAFFWLWRLKPDIILSFGGYVSVPVVMSGWVLGIPSITHEQTTILGLANRINSFFAKKVAVSWPRMVTKLSNQKVVLTGNPIRKEIFQVKEKIWQVLNFDKKKPLVFITGGNQGSHTINQIVLQSLPELIKKFNVFHQCGHLNALGDFEELQKARDKLSVKLKNRYHIKKYLEGDEMGTVLNKADLVVSRAGANTLTELCALGKPALLIPLPWLYQDEQTKNAQMLEKIGLAEILPQEELTTKTFVLIITKMIQNLRHYQENAFQAKRLIRLKAAQTLADIIEKTSREK